MGTEEIREVTLEDEHLSVLAELVLCGWLSKKADVQDERQPYWSFRDVSLGSRHMSSCLAAKHQHLQYLVWVGQL